MCLIRKKSYYRNSTPMMARVIRDLYFVGRHKQTFLARAFSLSQSSISRIISGQVWQ